MNATFFEPVIEIEIKKSVRTKDFETGIPSIFLSPGKVEAFEALKDRESWILIRGDGKLRGLSRKNWLLHWRWDRIEVKTGGKDQKEYFNDDELRGN